MSARPRNPNHWSRGECQRDVRIAPEVSHFLRIFRVAPERKAAIPEIYSANRGGGVRG
jgi:hypothetical protein